MPKLQHAERRDSQEQVSGCGCGADWRNNTTPVAGLLYYPRAVKIEVYHNASAQA
jgi:hypothetical protein